MNNLKNIIKSLLKILYIGKVKDYKLFCISFEGGPLGYDGKAFIEWLYKNNPGKYDIIWGIKDNKYREEYKNVRFIKIKSLRGIYHLLTSKVVLCNVNPPSYVPFRKNQIVINTWHASGAIKKVGKYMSDFNEEQFNMNTCFVSSSKIDTEAMIRDSFNYKGEVLPIGVPRTDSIFDKIELVKKKNIIREKYNISEKYSILLYEPTFRGDFELKQNTIDFGLVIKALNEKFNKKFVLLYRLHPMIAEHYKIEIESAIDVSLYPDNEDLLCAADVFITDYSSGVWEICLRKKPIFIYADDIDTYDRLYFPYTKWPYTVARNNEEFIKNIISFDEKTYLDKLNKYMRDMGCYDQGTSCLKLYEYLKEKGFTHKK